MNTQEILGLQITKTEKIKRLLGLGLTRNQVAELTGGNYGFVQNVFAKLYPEQVRSKLYMPTVFNRKFGVEIEAYGVSKTTIKSKLLEVGIQIEIEDYNHQARGFWKLINDSSLNGSNSWELVSPVLEGIEGLAELEKVCNVLKEKNVMVNKSCGLHIHFDAEQMDVEQVKNLLVNYANFEELIDSFMPNSRRQNSYCKSVKGYEAKIVNIETIRGLANLMGGRYFKINLQSYLRHGSIEFRQHSGTVEYNKISNWILLLHNLVHYSKTKRCTGTILELKKINQPQVFEYFQERKNKFN